MGRPSARGVLFPLHVITTQVDYARSVFAIDVDGDGDVEVLSASYHTVAWYENDGSENFKRHVITTKAYPEAVFAIDVDGDGDVDVLSIWDSTVAWFENDGSANFDKQIANAANASTLSGGDSVFAIDVDGDDDVDIVSAFVSHSSSADSMIAWYKNDGSQGFKQQVVRRTGDDDDDNYGEEPRSVFAIDVDGDADVDILSASYSDDTIAWYENDGSQNFKRHVITTNANGAHSVFAIDVDGDGPVMMWTFPLPRTMTTQSRGTRMMDLRTSSDT